MQAISANKRKKQQGYLSVLLFWIVILNQSMSFDILPSLTQQYTNTCHFRQQEKPGADIKKNLKI